MCLLLLFSVISATKSSLLCALQLLLMHSFLFLSPIYQSLNLFFSLVCQSPHHRSSKTSMLINVVVGLVGYGRAAMMTIFLG